MQATRRNHRILIVATLVALTAVISNVSAQQSGGFCRNYDGAAPPELVVAPKGWMNFDGELSLEKLRGHVVWLEFSFIDCGGCKMMKPHLQGLQHRYGPEGLVVIEINNGAVDTRDALAKEVEHLQPNYPVLWDKAGKTCDAYGVTQYGTAYLVGADGNVLWGGNPIDLTVVDMWTLVNRALRDVDLRSLAQACDPLLAHNIVSTSAPVHTHALVDDAAPPDRYTLGWDFSICTTDNSMLIDGVRRNSPAQLAGLLEGDTIVSIDDLVLSDVPFEQLKTRLHALEESPAAVTLGVRRDETTLSIVVIPEPTRR